MPIKEYRQGDLLEAKEPIIAHGVNCLGVMGAGVAKSIAKRWPKTELTYREHCMKFSQHKQLLMGTSIPTYEEADKKMIFNLFTQFGVGFTERQVDYGALARNFLELNNSLELMRGLNEQKGKETDENYVQPPSVVAIPKIGAGLGGGHWPIIEEIINGCTPDIHVVVYEKD